MWVNNVIDELLIKKSIHYLPTPSDIRIIGFIRNPWAWYVSWYNFIIFGSDLIINFDGGPTFKHMGQRPGNRPNFETMLKFYISPNSKFKQKIYYEGLAWSDVNNPWMFAWHKYTETWLDKDLPLYEHLYDLYFIDGCMIGKVENIREDLKQMLSSVNLLTPELINRIDNTPNINVGNKKVDYRTYYTDETAQLVADTHQRIITKHGYTFDK